LTGNSIASGGYVIQKNYNLGTAITAASILNLNYKVELPGFGDVSLR